MSANYKCTTHASENIKRKNGTAYEHRAIAEQMLGRPLKRTECVHHKDFNKKNNSPDNLMVFRTINDHSAFHLGRKAVLDGDVYYCPDKKEKPICPVCGERFFLGKNKNGMCWECFKNRKRKKLEERCSKDELERLICEIPFVAIGKMYGVSDNAVRKWCKAYGLPTKYHDVQTFKVSRADNSVRQS